MRDSDICSNKNSLFVQKRDSKSLFKVLLKLSKSMNHLESISLKNLQGARNFFSEEAFISGILKIFNEKKIKILSLFFRYYSFKSHNKSK